VSGALSASRDGSADWMIDRNRTVANEEVIRFDAIRFEAMGPAVIE
jgi:hypothetical protein